jgi:hypothetical protein
MVPPDVPPEDPMDVPLFGLTCLPDELWPTQQRIRQYRASHSETWGHVTFTIDSNLADAEVATPLKLAKNQLPANSYTIQTEEISDYISFPDSYRTKWLVKRGIYAKSGFENLAAHNHLARSNGYTKNRFSG